MITASIVTYQTNPQELKTLLECVNQSEIQLLYVVDNSPKDTLRELVHKTCLKAEYIFGQGNVGYGTAHNIAIRRAMATQAQYHVVLNPDIEFTPDTIQQLALYMDNNPDVGQVMPKIVYPNGELQYVCKLIPTPLDLIFKRFLPKVFSTKRMHKFQLKFTDYNQEMNVPYLSGCFMYFRITALQQVGLFDERFFMYPEDIDITRRMHEKYRTMFYPYTTVIHAHAAASRTNKKMLWIHISNMIKYFNKWGWFIDIKRRRLNKLTLKNLNYDE